MLDSDRPKRTQGGTTTECILELRKLIRTGRLSPGVQVRQDALAAQLNVSRTPLRQALNGLVSEGLIDHEPNVGYFVARLTRSGLTQTYLVRELLERQLYESLDFDRLDLDRLQALLQESIDATDVHEITRINREFHFTIFDASPLQIVRNFVDRAWSISEGYRSVYIVTRNARTRVADDHMEFIEALKARDVKRVLAIADSHREVALAVIANAVPE